MTFKGIDVSKYQGKVDWPAVKKAGIDFAMIRAISSKSSTYIDPTFEANYSGCKAAGIPVGCYIYTYATSQAQADKELTLLRSCLKGKAFEYPIALDVEDNALKTIGRERLTGLASYMLKTIESWGYFAQLYTYSSFAETALKMEELSGFNLWLADYRGTRPTRPHAMWQYSCKNALQVPGFGESLDCNLSYANFPAIIKAAKLNGFGGIRRAYKVTGLVNAEAEKKLKALCKELGLTVTEV